METNSELELKIIVELLKLYNYNASVAKMQADVQAQINRIQQTMASSKQHIMQFGKRLFGQRFTDIDQLKVDSEFTTVTLVEPTQQNQQSSDD